MKEMSINGRAYLLITCEICNQEYKQQKRIYKNALWKRRCKNHRKEDNKCKDCEKTVFRGSKRCKPCEAKRRSIPLKFCIDCGISINRKANKRCLKCHNKKQDKGLSLDRVKFQNSKEWKEVRARCFERDDYTCFKCSSRGLELNAHHIKSYAKYEDLRLELDNLITVCRSCHIDIHRRR